MASHEGNISVRERRRKRARNLFIKKHKTTPSGHDHKEEVSYYFENGLRKVYPYPFYFKTFVKGRWIGRTLIDIYSTEYQGTSLEDHVTVSFLGLFIKNIENGLVTVDGKRVTPEFKLQSNQLIENKLHRHEGPVLDTPIQIIADTEDVLVVNKPSSLPVHPCGRYRHNSLSFILEHEKGYTNLRTLYRLDRLTSGVLIMPKNAKTSSKMESQLERRLLHKEYVCRVVGKFPDGEIECHEPLDLLSRRLSMYGVKPTGKPSSTTFTRLSYNGTSSVVKCVPHTGRTHQIRVHLQYLGHPIVNDPLYNSTAFGSSKGKGGIIERSMEELEKIIAETNNVGTWAIGDNPDYVAKFGEDGLKPAPADTLPVEDEEEEADTDSDVVDGGGAYFDEDREKVEIGGDSVDSGEGRSVADMRKDCRDGLIDEQAVIDEVKDELVEGGRGDTKDIGRTDKSAENVMSMCDETDINVTLAINDIATQEFSTERPLKRPKLETDKHTTLAVINTESAHTTITHEKPARPVFERRKLTVDRHCDMCRKLYMDPKPQDLILFLHAVRYKGPDWEYSTELPPWALEDFVETETNRTTIHCAKNLATNV
ncbi:pseudouridylate synthase RPUSD2-like isoform X1 [Mya arenaria]|uniref:pseudouridylate synthase RPUSD2-like isoform X1 n=1 Tax=Mya arenaria TaxID=6604 RepID=UPI0022DF1571|nr:pseudouridylate synthase RPUSD2-like isoform X1 [Mya arenaria]